MWVESKVVLFSGYARLPAGTVASADYKIWSGILDSTRATDDNYIFIAKGYSPWFNGNCGNSYYEYMDIWEDSSHVVSVDESVPGQATVTCDGNITDMSSMFNLPQSYFIRLIKL